MIQSYHCTAHPGDQEKDNKKEEKKKKKKKKGKKDPRQTKVGFLIGLSSYQCCDWTITLNAANLAAQLETSPHARCVNGDGRPYSMAMFLGEYEE